MEQAVNTFGEGLVTDYNPLLAPENTLTDALNATFVTMNGNEVMLQNDMGNGRVETAFLPSGFVPVGVKEHGGIIYVASHNPLTGESLIGSFPSPERNIDDREIDEKKEGYTPPTLGDIVTRTKKDDKEEWTVSEEKIKDELTQTIPLFNGKILNPGDKFAIVIPEGISNYKPYLSHCYNTSGNNVDSPKLSESEISVLVLDSTKNLSDITDTLIRCNEDLSQHSEEFKRNYKYFIWDDFNAESDESNYFNNNAKFENTRKVNSLNLNTYLNKFSGSLFLSRKYSIIDHIECSNIDWEPTKSSNPTVVNGTLSFDLIYYYNCPDGFYIFNDTSSGVDRLRIGWEKGLWKESNLSDSTLISSVNLKFQPKINSTKVYSYCPNYDVLTKLYKFIIPYNITLKNSAISNIEIDDHISGKNGNNIFYKLSDYNYVTWIGQNYNYSVIQGSNIKMNYNNGIGEFIITPKMYYSTLLEDLAISFTLQLLTDVTPEPVTPVTGEWGNSDGFGYFWAPSKYNQNNDYVFLFKESYFEKENDLYKYKINLRLYKDFNTTWKWEEINILDKSYVWEDTGLTLDNEKVFVHWHNIGPNDYFGYIEIINSANEAEEKFWIFPRNIVPYNYSNPTASYIEDGARLRKLDTFDVLYTTDFSSEEKSPTNKLSASYYITGNAISMELGYTEANSNKTYHPLYISSNNLEFGNIKYIFAESIIPQSICLVIKKSITNPVLRQTPYFMINYENNESSSSFSPSTDYFYPCVYDGDDGYELLIPKILNNSEDPENISITDWWKDEDTPSLNFLTNEVSLQLYTKAGNYTQASTKGFEIIQNVDNLIKDILDNTLSELPKNYTEVND